MILNTGKVDIQILGKIPDNIYAYYFVPQIEVLQHADVFLTHCGMNSVNEAMALGVPMVAVPCWSEQFSNAKLVEDVWKIGIRAKADDKQIVRREVLKHCILEIMNTERGKEVKSNVMEFKALAEHAVSEEGTSHKNTLEFLNSLAASAQKYH